MARQGKCQIRLSFAGIGAWKWLLRPPQPWGWLLHLGGCPGARFISFICESMTVGGSTSYRLVRMIGKAREVPNSPIVRRNWGMEVAPEASTAMGMAFTYREMSRGKVCEPQLGIHGQQDLQGGPNSCRRQVCVRAKFRPLFVQNGAWKWLLRPPQPWRWLLHLGGCPGARFMRFICVSMTMRGSTSSNLGQIAGKGGAKKFDHRSYKMGHGSGS